MRTLFVLLYGLRIIGIRLLVIDTIVASILGVYVKCVGLLVTLPVVYRCESGITVALTLPPVHIVRPSSVLMTTATAGVP